MSITDLDLRSVWSSLSLSNKFFFLYFCGVSIYTLSLCLYLHIRIHSLKREHAAEKTSLTRPLIDALSRRLANLRQLHLFTFYLFGFCIVFNIPNAFVTLGLYKTEPIGLYIRGLTFLFYFDAPIFLGFLLLHSLQWVASVRVDSFVRHQNA